MSLPYLAVTVDIQDSASPALRAAMERLANRQPLNSAMGLAVEKTVIDNFARKGGEGNKLGAPSTGYYQKAASSVRVQADSQAAFVSIPWRGIRLHYYGGTVVAGANGSGKHWLTIPARAEAHGKTVKEVFGGYANCVWLFNRDKKPFAIAAKGDGKGKNKAQGGMVYFWLAKSAKIPKDHTVLPPMEVMQGAALTAAESHVARVTASQGGLP